jgi:ABC-type sugar transport system substrate-binding protein
MNQTKGFLFSVLLLAASWLSGCGDSREGGGAGASAAVSSPGPAGAAPAAGRRMKICLLPKLKGIPYFTSCHAGAEEAARELGDVELIYDGPTEGSAEKQAAMIEKWTLQKVDAIAVAPNAPDVVEKAMNEARRAGIKVLTWDADGTKESRDFFINQATAEAIGFGMVDAMAKDLGGDSATGDVAIISSSPTSANQNSWIGPMQQRLKDKYPGLRNVAVKYPGEDQKQALQDAQDLIKAYPNLRGLFGISSVAFPGAAEGVKQAGKAGKVLVTGLSTPNPMKSYVKDGVVKTVVLWNTRDLGYLTIRTAHALVKGELKPGATSIQAGRLGAKPIVGDNVMLGDALVFTPDNIDQFDF